MREFITEFDKIVARGMPIGSANLTTENRRGKVEKEEGQKGRGEDIRGEEKGEEVNKRERKWREG